MASRSSWWSRKPTHRIKCGLCYFFQDNQKALRQFRHVDAHTYRFISMLNTQLKNKGVFETRNPVCPQNVRRRFMSSDESLRLFSEKSLTSLSNYRPDFHRKSANRRSSHWYELSRISNLCLFSTGRKHIRLSSEDSKNGENQRSSSKTTNNTNEGAAKDKSILDKDPELKSIIEEIKRDFAKDQLKDKTPKTPPKKESQEVYPTSKEGVGEIKFGEDKFEYDYSVAEDIEEYDYIDESDMGQHQVQPQKDIPISLQRGKDGVFDLDELLLLLEHLGAENIVSFPIPPEAKFCDHMIVVSAKSLRHLQAINEEMLYIHKRKKSEDDTHLVIEGIKKSEWCAMDLGNIVLHVFYGNMREYYDIESLWTLGPDHDPKCQETDKDPYALSAEDLFWLEAAKTKETTTGTTTVIDKETERSVGLKSSKRVPSPPPQVSDSDAGWGNSPSQPRK